MSLIQAEMDILDAAECKALCDAVHGLHRQWIPRNVTLPFFTLGAASYLDATPEAPWYYPELAAAHNPLLSEHFGWLHRRCCKTLSEWLGAPVELHAGLAFPGFHVFQAHEAFARDEAASAHWDLQFTKIRWHTDDTPDFSRPLSFTLPVRLPLSGGGLNLWEVAHSDAEKLSENERERRRRDAARQFHAYTIGRMVIHTGLYLHQIAPIRDASPGEERITFQGHAIQCAGIWRLYW